MKGGKNKKPFGYTIVEVMIVLAVSGVMFLIAAEFISGKQEHTAFLVGTNQIASQIQSTIEQVQDGNYSDYPINCTSLSPTNISISSGTGSQSTQGTNISCVFVGKFIHFNVSGSPVKYEIFTLVSSSQNTNGLVSGYVWPVTSTSATPGGGVPLTAYYNMPQSINVISVRATSVSGGINYGFGIVQSLNNPNAAGATISGAQGYQLVFAPQLLSGQNETNAATEITAGGLANASSVIVCVSDGSLYADIEVGINNSNKVTNQLSVVVQQLGTQKCT